MKKKMSRTSGLSRELEQLAQHKEQGKQLARNVNMRICGLKRVTTS